MKTLPCLPCALVGVVLLVAGCSGDNGAPPAAQSNGKGPDLPRVETGRAALGPLAVEAERTGTLRARRRVKITNQEEGRLIRLPFFEGDRVEEGQELFALDDTLLRAQLERVRAEREQAELDLRRVSGLHAKRLASEDELARARTALQVARAEERLLGARLGYARVHAPFDGLVAERPVEPGDALARFSHVLTLIDPESLVTRVSVSELLLPALSVGQPVELTIDALGETPVSGRILRIHPTVDAGTRRGVVEVALADPPPVAREGQLSRVRLRGEAAERLTVPFAALRRDQTGEFVYRVGADGVVQRVEVISGAAAGERIVVRGELSDGDAVVVKGFLEVRDGVTVQRLAATGE